MKTLILATTAILTLGLGSAFASTPTVQAQTQLAQQQERPATEVPAYQNRRYPAPSESGGYLALQQERPMDETPAYQNRRYPVPEGGVLALQQERPGNETPAYLNQRYPVPEGG